MGKRRQEPKVKEENSPVESLLVLTVVQVSAAQTTRASPCFVNSHTPLVTVNFSQMTEFEGILYLTVRRQLNSLAWTEGFGVRCKRDFRLNFDEKKKHSPKTYRLIIEPAHGSKCST